eukprot:CFRG0242T1
MSWFSSDWQSIANKDWANLAKNAIDQVKEGVDKVTDSIDAALEIDPNTRKRLKDVEDPGIGDPNVAAAITTYQGKDVGHSTISGPKYPSKKTSKPIKAEWRFRTDSTTSKDVATKERNSDYGSSINTKLTSNSAICSSNDGPGDNTVVGNEWNAANDDWNRNAWKEDEEEAYEDVVIKPVTSRNINTQNASISNEKESCSKKDQIQYHLRHEPGYQSMAKTNVKHASPQSPFASDTYNNSAGLGVVQGAQYETDQQSAELPQGKTGNQQNERSYGKSYETEHKDQGVHETEFRYKVQDGGHMHEDVYERQKQEEYKGESDRIVLQYEDECQRRGAVDDLAHHVMTASKVDSVSVDEDVDKMNEKNNQFERMHEDVYERQKQEEYKGESDRIVLQYEDECQRRGAVDDLAHHVMTASKVDRVSVDEDVDKMNEKNNQFVDNEQIEQVRKPEAETTNLERRESTTISRKAMKEDIVAVGVKPDPVVEEAMTNDNDEINCLDLAKQRDSQESVQVIDREDECLSGDNWKEADGWKEEVEDGNLALEERGERKNCRNRQIVDTCDINLAVERVDAEDDNEDHDDDIKATEFTGVLMVEGGLQDMNSIPQRKHMNGDDNQTCQNLSLARESSIVKCDGDGESNDTPEDYQLGESEIASFYITVHTTDGRLEGSSVVDEEFYIDDMNHDFIDGTQQSDTDSDSTGGDAMEDTDANIQHSNSSEGWEAYPHDNSESTATEEKDSGEADLYTLSSDQGVLDQPSDKAAQTTRDSESIGTKGGHCSVEGQGLWKQNICLDSSSPVHGDTLQYDQEDDVRVSEECVEGDVKEMEYADPLPYEDTVQHYEDNTNIAYATQSNTDVTLVTSDHGETEIYDSKEKGWQGNTGWDGRDGPVQGGHQAAGVGESTSANTFTVDCSADEASKHANTFEHAHADEDANVEYEKKRCADDEESVFAQDKPSEEKEVYCKQEEMIPRDGNGYEGECYNQDTKEEHCLDQGADEVLVEYTKDAGKLSSSDIREEEESLRAQQVVHLSLEVGQLQETNDLLQSEKDELERTNEHLMGKITEMSESIFELRESNDSLSEAYRRSEHARTQAQKEAMGLSQLEAQVVEKDEEIQGLIEEGTKLSMALHVKDTAIKKLREKLKEVEGNFVSIQKSAAEKDVYLAKTTNEKNSLADKLNVNISTVKSLTKELEPLRNELENTLHELESSRQTCNKYRDKVEVLNTELDNVRKNGEERVRVIEEKAMTAQLGISEDVKIKFEKEIETGKEAIDLLRGTIIAMEKAHKGKESELEELHTRTRREADELRARLQEQEHKADDLMAELVTSAQPLNKQIDSLRTALAEQQDDWMQMERSYTERLAEAKERVRESESEQQVFNRRYDEMKENMAKLTNLLAHERQVHVDKLHEVVARQEELIQSHKEEVESFVVEKERIEASHMQQIKLMKSRVDEQTSRATDLERMNEVLSIQNKEIRTNLERLQFEITEIQQKSSSGSADLPHQSDINSQESVLPLTSTSPSCSPLQNGSSSSERFGRIPTETLNKWEQMKGMLHQREREVANLQRLIQEETASRISMEDELSSIVAQNEELRMLNKHTEKLQADYEATDKKYQTILQMYGQKAEQAEEYRLDLEDIKDMYKDQINHLIARITELEAIVP